MNRMPHCFVRGLAVACAATVGDALADDVRIEIKREIKVEIKAEPQAKEPDAAAGGEANKGPLVQAVEGGVRVLLGVPAAEPAGPAAARQQQILQQQAKQMEQMLQPVLHAELEFMRTTFGTLAPEAKRAIKTAAAEAVREAALQFAAQQNRPGRRSLDLGRIFAEKLDPVVERTVAPAAAATWRRERDARTARRAETARVLIVAKLDEELELTTAQRDAILADLRLLWDDTWLRELLDQGGFVVNEHRPAPDYAEECITPHLDDRQRQAWTAWVKAAGWERAGQHLGWQFPNGPGLMGPDTWWQR